MRDFHHERRKAYQSSAFSLFRRDPLHLGAKIEGGYGANLLTRRGAYRAGRKKNGLYTLKTLEASSWHNSHTK
jgi:hypothetical protein